MFKLKKIIRLVKRVISEVRFRIFELRIHKSTWKRHDAIYASCEELKNREHPVQSSFVKRGMELRQKVLDEFRDKYSKEGSLRILIHLPPKSISPGGFSLFSNLLESLNYIGIPTKALGWDEKIGDLFSSFQPTCLLTSDSFLYLNRIDWEAVASYKRINKFFVGLTVSADSFREIPAVERIKWAKDHSVDFYYGFRAPEYYEERPDYAPIMAAGFPIHTVEFGANPLIYYPLDGIQKDLDYVFLASSNSDKHKRYFQWLSAISKKFPGFINGPGWRKISKSMPKDLHRFLYAKAKVGINLHIDESIDWASELNERSYILAACGVPQLMDNPKLLLKRFSKEAMFQADTPAQYELLFQEMLSNPSEAKRRALIAMEEVFSKHTTFHRADSFVKKLQTL